MDNNRLPAVIYTCIDKEPDYVFVDVNKNLLPEYQSKIKSKRYHILYVWEYDNLVAQFQENEDNALDNYTQLQKYQQKENNVERKEKNFKEMTTNQPSLAVQDSKLDLVSCDVSHSFPIISCYEESVYFTFDIVFLEACIVHEVVGIIYNQFNNEPSLESVNCRVVDFVSTICGTDAAKDSVVERINKQTQGMNSDSEVENYSTLFDLNFEIVEGVVRERVLKQIHRKIPIINRCLPCMPLTGLFLSNVDELCVPLRQFYWASKLDGVRFFVLYQDESMFIIRRDLTVYKHKNLTVDETLHGILLDGEMIYTKNLLTMVFLDILFGQSLSLIRVKFSTRLTSLQNHFKMIQSKSSINVSCFQFALQTYKMLDYAYDLVEQKSGYPTDGLVFILNTSYTSLYSTFNLKWKESNNITADFLVCVENSKSAIKLKVKHNGEYVFYASSTEQVLYGKHGKIVEFAYDSKLAKWLYVGDRNDKNEPNSSFTVKAMITNEHIDRTHLVTKLGDCFRRKPISKTVFTAVSRWNGRGNVLRKPIKTRKK